MEQNPSSYRPVSRPRPRLKMPLFGNMFGGGGGSPRPSNEEPHPLTKRITPIIIAIAVIAFGLDYFMKSSAPKTSFRGNEEIQASTFNGKILRKWYNVIPPNNDVEYVVEILTDKNEKRIVSFLNEKSNIGDFVLPYNKISKKENSLNLTVTRYFKVDTITMSKDTVLVLKY
jgi:hypothetical protein